MADTQHLVKYRAVCDKRYSIINANGYTVCLCVHVASVCLRCWRGRSQMCVSTKLGRHFIINKKERANKCYEDVNHVAKLGMFHKDHVHLSKTGYETLARLLRQIKNRRH